MTVNPPVGSTATAFRIDIVDPILFYLGLIDMFRVHQLCGTMRTTLGSPDCSSLAGVPNAIKL